MTRFEIYLKALKESLMMESEKLIDYLQMKVKTQDWHGVADCAMDLRDVEARLDILKAIREYGPIDK